MSDLIERLAKWTPMPGESITGDVQLYMDAKAEIERLRAMRGTSPSVVWLDNSGTEAGGVSSAYNPHQDKSGNVGA